jgi:hypothetical protein
VLLDADDADAVEEAGVAAEEAGVDAALPEAAEETLSFLERDAFVPAFSEHAAAGVRSRQIKAAHAKRRSRPL